METILFYSNRSLSLFTVSSDCVWCAESVALFRLILMFFKYIVCFSFVEQWFDSNRLKRVMSAGIILLCASHTIIIMAVAGSWVLSNIRTFKCEQYCLTPPDSIIPCSPTTIMTPSTRNDAFVEFDVHVIIYQQALRESCRGETYRRGDWWLIDII